MASGALGPAVTAIAAQPFLLRAHAVEGEDDFGGRQEVTHRCDRLIENRGVGMRQYRADRDDHSD